MLERLTIPGINLPRLYVAHNQGDADDAMYSGIPFVMWRGKTEDLVRGLLRPALEKLFPYIKWDRVLGKRRPFKTIVVEVPGESGVGNAEADRQAFEEAYRGIESEEDESSEISEKKLFEEPTDENGSLIEVADVASDIRIFDGEGVVSNTPKLSLEEYIGDLSSSVNLEVLQTLKLMPAFIGDITDCIKRNISERLYWTEGYNKKRRAPLGNFDATKQLPNLMILDISGSIPRGIAATMIQLIDTLRTETHSDLIITASMSRFYPHGSQLPDAQTIRDEFGYGNESEDFKEILKKYICGRKWGHVISFGDDDCPDYEGYEYGSLSFAATSVKHVHHFHTNKYSRRENLHTGYARWCNELTGCEPEISVNTDWCKVIKDSKW